MGRISLVVLLGLALACGPAVSSEPTDLEADPGGGETPALTMSQLEVAEGVTAMAVTCEEGATESCNAIDDDCNGIIDDSCGYAGGAVQVTVMWNGDVDLNLALGGDAAATATTDQAGKGACEQGEGRAGRVENAHWAGAAPMAGTYEVSLAFADACETGLERATATVSVSVSGKVIGVYNVTLEAGSTRPVLSFVLA